MPEDPTRETEEHERPSSSDAWRELCFADPLFRERYEGWTELGRGLCSVVVRTTSTVDSTLLAVKILSALSPDQAPMFARESKAARAVASPFIVRTWSAFVRGPISWLEMEYVEGTDLDRELERREAAKEPFSIEECLDIGLAVARALACAHGTGVLHRDIKPANILLPRWPPPPAKLTDFGIAKFYNDSSTLTRTTAFRGTPWYASPEAFDSSSTVGLPADIYGLGLALYLLVSNQRYPFDLGDNPTTGKIGRAHQRVSPKALREFRPDTPSALEDLVGRCTAKKPEQRPVADEVVAALEEIQSARQRSSKEPRPVPAGARSWKRPAAWGALAAAVIVGAIAVVTALAGRNHQSGQIELNAPAPVAETPQPAPTPPPPVRVGTSAGFVEVTSSVPMDGIVLSVSTSDGKHVYRMASLTAEETVWIAESDFSPPLPQGASTTGIEVSGRSGGEQVRYRLRP